MLGNDEYCIAYIFLKCPVNNDDLADIAEWGSGESAIIVQPGGDDFCNTKNMKEGPCLFDEDGNHHEYIPILVEGYDPDFISDEDFGEMEESEQHKYLEQIQGNKIGGVPYFFRGDEWPYGDWKFLLQISNWQLPFVLSLGDEGIGMLFAFIFSDFKQGGLLIQS